MNVRLAVLALVVPHVIARSVGAQPTLPPAPPPPPEPPPGHVLHAPQYCTIEARGGFLTLGEMSATGSFGVFLRGPVYQTIVLGTLHSITVAGSLQVSDQMDYLRIPFEVHNAQERNPEALEGSFRLLVEHSPSRRPRSFLLTLHDLDSGQSWQIDEPAASGDPLDFRLRTRDFTLRVECALSEEGAGAAPRPAERTRR